MSLVGFLFPSYAAVRYHRSDAYLPDYLVRGTLQFGVNFLTFQAVEAETLDSLAKCLNQPWASRTAEGDEQEEEEDEEEDRLSLSADLLCRIGHRAPPAEQSELTAVTEQRDRALNRILANSVVAEAAAVDQPTEAQQSPAAGDASAPSSSQGTQAKPKRKRKSTSSAGSRPTKSQKSTPKTSETVDSDEGKSLCCLQTNKQTNKTCFTIYS